MKTSRKWMLFAASLLLPAIGMLYLYNRNLQYLVLDQVLLVTALLMAIDAIGYGVLKLIFRSGPAAFGGCATAWVAFFAFRSFVGKGGGAYVRTAAIYALSTLAAVFLIAFLIKKLLRRGGDAVSAIAFLMAAVLFAMNAAPAVYTSCVESATRQRGSVYKETFATDGNLPSPNVYWIHADGMLGFEAMEKYFGDDQAEFLAALEARGFFVNHTARLEAAHTTQLAIPALMCPEFYDTQLKKELDDYAVNRKFSYNASVFKRNARVARVKNETQRAFKLKDYTTQTISILGTYFPLTSDKFYYLPNDELYTAAGSGKPCLVSLGDYSEEKYLSIMDSHELANLLFKIKDGYYDILFRLSAAGILNVGLERKALSYEMDDAAVKEKLLGSEDAAYYGIMLRELNDALQTPGPCFTIICDMMAHSPFLFDENGNFQTAGSKTALENYPAQHRYAAKVLISMIDMILEKDAEAVIVIEADHGLHVQTAEEIAQKLGEGAQIDIWNQVTSAVRVPAAYQNDSLPLAQEEPRNIARWLVNSFVGENYEYIEK